MEIFGRCILTSIMKEGLWQHHSFQTAKIIKLETSPIIVPSLEKKNLSFACLVWINFVTEEGAFRRASETCSYLGSRLDFTPRLLAMCGGRGTTLNIFLLPSVSSVCMVIHAG